MKRMNFRLCAMMAAAVFAAAACSVNEEAVIVETPQEEAQDGVMLPSVLIIELEGGDTKTTYDYSSGRLYTHWADGDAVYASPAGASGYGTVYRVPQGGAAAGTFAADRPISVRSSTHAFYHPGDKIYNDTSFGRFSYEGQVQSKSDPTAHMGAYHSMRQIVSLSDYNSAGNYDVSGVSFRGCDQSGCIRFLLSGTIFVNPQEIRLEVYSGDDALTDVLYSSNYLGTYFPDQSTGQQPSPVIRAKTLSLGLEGFAEETSLTAYMMHSNRDMNLPAGCSLRVTVLGDNAVAADVPIPAATAIKGGCCSTISIDSGWRTLEGDYTKYPWDGEAVTLQEGCGGLDIVLMGDGFIKEDFDSGKYDRVMRQCCEDFFSVEPYATFRNDFSVYYVKAVSPQRLDAVNTGLNGAGNSGNITLFSVRFTPNSTSTDGDLSLALAYAKKAFTTDADERIKDALVMVVANHECHAGTCHTYYTSESEAYDYGKASAVAFLGLGINASDRANLVHHELGGHGFGKLDDEYHVNRQIGSTQPWIDREREHAMGLYRNVDRFVNQNYYSQLGGRYALTDMSNVYWHDLFGTVNNYESASVESLGVFEGAGGYVYGFCRPTQAVSRSIMNGNTGIFNAISRRQILYRYRHLRGEVAGNIYGTAEELQYFLQWDAANFLPKLGTMMSAPQTRSSVEEFQPLPPPVLEYGTWEDGVFITMERN